MAEQLQAVLTLDDTTYTVKMKGAGKTTRLFNKNVANLNKTIKRNEGALRRSASALHTWTLTLGQARNAINNIWMVTGAWMSVLVKTSAELENMTKLLEGMSDAVDAKDRIKDAATDLEYLMETAKNSPFSVSALTDSFVKFKSVGLDPATEGMESLVNAVAAFGGTDETLARASIAIQQMAGKGVISMEELRQQLGEAVPQAITIMARSMGVTYGELVKEISKGTVEAKSALEAMFNGFDIAYGGRAVALMDTYKGAIAGLKTSWMNLIRESEGIQNFFKKITESVRALTEFLESESAMRVANAVGDMLSRIASGFIYAIENFEYFKGQFSAILKTVNDSRLNPDSFLAGVLQTLKDIIDFTFGAGRGLSMMAKDLGISGVLDMSKEEFEKSVFEDRIKAQADFLDEEMSQLQAYRGKLADERGAIEAEYATMAEAFEMARQDPNGDHVNNVVNRGYIQSSGELIAVLKNLEFHETAVGKAREKLAENERKRLELHDRMKVARNKEIYTIPVEIEKLRAEAAVIQEEINLAGRAHLENIPRAEKLKEALIALKNQTGLTVQEFATLHKGGEGFEDIAAKVDSIAADLEGLSTESGPMGRFAQRMLDIKARIEEIGEIEVSLDEVISQETVDQAESLADDALESLNDLILQHSAASSEVMNKAWDAMTDKSVQDSEARYQNAAEIANAFFDQQLSEISALQAATLAALAEQGEAGAIASAIATEQFAAQMAKINAQREKYLSTMKGGIIKVDSGSGGGAGKAAQNAIEKLRLQAKEAGERLRRGLVDPFTYELPSAVESLRVKFNDLANETNGGAWTSEMKELFTVLGQDKVSNEIGKIADATRRWQIESLGVREAREKTMRLEIARLKNMRERLIEEGLWRVEWESVIQERIQALQEQAFDESPLGKFANSWKNYFEDMEQFGVDTMKSVGGEVAALVVDGKASFAELARSALKAFLQIQINAAIAAAASYFTGGIGAGSGASGGGASVSHSGSIVGAPNGRSRHMSAMAFAGAPRFHTGGIIGQEVPAILEKGEGVFTKEQMKVLGMGMRSGNLPEVKFNLINNSGQELNSEEQNVRFDGRAMILDVVVKAAGQPGPFRDTLKRSLK